MCGAHLCLTPGDLADLLVGGAGQGKVELVQCLLVAGADPDIPTIAQGNTALHAAVEVGNTPHLILHTTYYSLQGDHIEMVKLLAQHGASYRVANKYSLTPLDIATKLGRTEIVKLYEKFLNT